MRFDDQLREASARGFSIMRRYHQGERTAEARVLLIAEVETLVGWLMELDLPPGAVVIGIFEPVEADLLSRYGHEVGRGLNAEFVEAIGTTGIGLLSRK